MTVPSVSKHTCVTAKNKKNSSLSLACTYAYIKYIFLAYVIKLCLRICICINNISMFSSVIREKSCWRLMPVIDLYWIYCSQKSILNGRRKAMAFHAFFAAMPLDMSQISFVILSVCLNLMPTNSNIFEWFGQFEIFKWMWTRSFNRILSLNEIIDINLQLISLETRVTKKNIEVFHLHIENIIKNLPNRCK